MGARINTLTTQQEIWDLCKSQNQASEWSYVVNKCSRDEAIVYLCGPEARRH